MNGFNEKERAILAGIAQGKRWQWLDGNGWKIGGVRQLPLFHSGEYRLVEPFDLLTMKNYANNGDLHSLFFLIKKHEQEIIDSMQFYDAKQEKFAATALVFLSSVRNLKEATK